MTRALNAAHGIPFEVPTKDGTLLKTVSPEVVKNTFKGVVGHYHITEAKIGPGCLPIDKIVGELKHESKA